MKYQPTDQDLIKVEESFTYLLPKDDQGKRYEELRNTAKNMAVLFLTHVPPSRERSLAITKLEESIMWANKAIACNE